MMLNLNPNEACDRLCASSPVSLFLLAMLGGFTGVVSSFIVASTLVEMTVNLFFSLYFGLLLLFISALLYYRLHYSHQPHPQRHLVLLVFISLIFLAALTGLLLHPLLSFLPHILHLSVYTLLGLALTFAFYFSLFDLLNYAMSLYVKHTNPSLNPPPSGPTPTSALPALPTLPSPLISTQPQIFLLTLVSSVMGLAFGLTFALLDVEDSATPAELRAALHEDLMVTYPLGFLLGGAGAMLNAALPQMDGGGYEGLDGAEGEEGEFGL